MDLANLEYLIDQTLQSTGINVSEYATEKVMEVLRKELESFEHIATVQLPDPLDERDGVYYDIDDRKRLQQLKAGDKLYVVRKNPMTVDNQRKVDEFTAARISKAAKDGHITMPEEQ